MIEDQEVASEVSKTLQVVFDVLGDSLLLVRQRCSHAEAAAYSERVGNVFYEIVFKMLEPIYEKHPDLKPPDWEKV